MKVILIMTIIRPAIAIMIAAMQEIHCTMVGKILMGSMQEIHCALVGKRPSEDISLLRSSIR